MSLIYQALRKLGSDTRGGFTSRAGPWQEPATLRVSRPVLVWWVLGAVLSSAAVTAWLMQADAGDAVGNAGGNAAPKAISAAGSNIGAPALPVAESVPETPQLTGAATKSAGVPVAGEEAIADPGAPIQAAPVLASFEGLQDRAEPPPAEAKPAPEADQAASALETSSADPARQPVAASVSNPVRRPVRDKAAQALIQAKSRERSVQIARLTSNLTNAAQAGDQPETQRLLKELEASAGANSNYSLNMRAYLALVREDYAEVEALLGVVLARDQFDINAGLNMAVAESRTGRLKQARRRLERLTLLHPHDDRVAALLRSFEQGS